MLCRDKVKFTGLGYCSKECRVLHLAEIRAGAKARVEAHKKKSEKVP